ARAIRGSAASVTRSPLRLDDQLRDGLILPLACVDDRERYFIRAWPKLCRLHNEPVILRGLSGGPGPQQAIDWNIGIRKRAAGEVSIFSLRDLYLGRGDLSSWSGGCCDGRLGKTRCCIRLDREV